MGDKGPGSKSKGKKQKGSKKKPASGWRLRSESRAQRRHPGTTPLARAARDHRKGPGPDPGQPHRLVRHGRCRQSTLRGRSVRGAWV